jgi:hypothetical protein
MKYIGLIGRIVLVLAFGLGLLIVMADDSEVASIDPHHPATLLPLVASRLHTVQSYVRDFRAREFLDALAAGDGEPTRHENPTPSPEQ